MKKVNVIRWEYVLGLVRSGKADIKEY